METTYTLLRWNWLNNVDVSQWVLCLVSRNQAYKYNVFYRYMYWVSAKQTWLILWSTLHCLCYRCFQLGMGSIYIYIYTAHTKLEAPVFAIWNNDSVALHNQRILTRPSYRCTRTWYHTCIQCTQYLVISPIWAFGENENFHSLPKGAGNQCQVISVR